MVGQAILARSLPIGVNHVVEDGRPQLVNGQKENDRRLAPPGIVHLHKHPTMKVRSPDEKVIVFCHLQRR